MNKFIYYLPRILAIIIVIFLAVFILEIFGSEFSWQGTIGHLLLALVFLVFTLVAWKWPKIGGWFFVLAGGYYLFLVIKEYWWGGIAIGGVPLLTGIVFLLEGFRKK